MYFWGVCRYFREVSDPLPLRNKFPDIWPIMAIGALEYHCHHKHFQSEYFLSKRSPAIWYRTITETKSKRINSANITVSLPALGKTKNSTSNYRLSSVGINLIMTDRLATGEYSGIIHLVMISVTMAIRHKASTRLCGEFAP